MTVNDVNEVDHYGSDFFFAVPSRTLPGCQRYGFFLPQMQDYWRHQINILRRGNKSVFFFFFWFLKILIRCCEIVYLYQVSNVFFCRCSFLIYLFNLTDGKKWFGFFSHFVCLFVCWCYMRESMVHQVFRSW